MNCNEYEHQRKKSCYIIVLVFQQQKIGKEIEIMNKLIPIFFFFSFFARKIEMNYDMQYWFSRMNISFITTTIINYTQFFFCFWLFLWKLILSDEIIVSMSNVQKVYILKLIRNQMIKCQFIQWSNLLNDYHMINYFRTWICFFLSLFDIFLAK